MDKRSYCPPKSPITRWKRTDQSDTSQISSLINDEANKNYGPVDVSRLIEVCSASITLYNGDESAVAFAALCDYPNIPSIMYSWPEWIAKTYGLSHLNPLNTLFIHLMAFDELYYPEFFPQIMEKVYMDSENLDFVILLLPPRSICYNLLNMYFKRSHKLKDVPPEQIRACYVNNRWLHFGKFALRKTGDEDGNSIVVKLKKSKDSNEIKYKKVIIQKDPFRTCIVEETPIAGDCICLSTKLNYGKLSEAYDLRSVNGFKVKASREHRMMSLPIKIPHNYISASVEHGFKPNNKPPVNQFTPEAMFYNDTASLCYDISEENLRYEDVILFEPGRLLSGIPYVTRQTSSMDYDSADGIISYNRPPTTSMFGFKPDIAPTLPSFYDTLLYNTNKKHFMGSGNAFAIEALITHNKKARNIDYLRKIFEFAPGNLSFCLIEVPFNLTPPRLLNYFHKCEKVDKSHQCELYVCHQLAITGTMSVRPGWPSDMEDIIGMTFKTLYGNSLLETVHNVFFQNATDKEVYLMLSENLIIGVAVVCPETKVEFFKATYELDDLMCTSQIRGDECGEVVHFIVSPLFYHYIRFFLKEIMRYTGYHALFLSVYSKIAIRQKKIRTWPSGLQRWVPVPPRTLAKQAKETVRKLYPRAYEQIFDTNFALFFINRRIASMTLNLDNRNIVVVGHGNTAISFIENLVYSKKKCYFNFCNIQILSPDSLTLGDTLRFSQGYKDLVPVAGKYSTKYLDRIGISAYVDYIPGRMTSIDRERRTIGIDFSYEMHYDYLFILCGTQFTRPDMKKVVENETKTNVCKDDTRGRTLEDYYSDDFPLNLCILDSIRDIDMFIHFIVESYSQFTHEDYLVVYGGRINAWSCIHFLLKYIPGKEIAFVENLNETTHSLDAFNNPLIHEACKHAILNAEVKYYSSYQFSSWEMRRQNALISKVNFMGDKNELSLKCVAFISFSPKTIYPTTIMALNKSGLEFDGKLIIDNKFRTSDPRIYAAGSVTRYSKEYYYDHFNHEHYNSLEVGTKLAEIFIEEVCNEKETPEPEPEVPPLVDMKEPLILSCILPRNVNYLRVSPPGPQFPFEQLASLGRIGKVMVTGDVFEFNSPRYFRIMMDKFDKVMEITCYTSNEIDIVSLSRLYGKHKQLLNEVCWRYDNNLISDFYEFFNQPWATIIYHDRFSNFLNDIFPLHENIKNYKDKELYLKLAADLTTIKNERKERIIKSKMLSILNKNGLDKGLCNSLMGFLEFNKDLLPTYLTPSRLEQHCKVNYTMNQLLEPPVFAKDHLQNFIPYYPRGDEGTVSSIEGNSKLLFFAQNESSSSVDSIFDDMHEEQGEMNTTQMIRSLSLIHVPNIKPESQENPKETNSSMDSNSSFN